MGIGVYSVFTQTIASGATLSAEFDIGRSWENVYLEIPTMTSNTQMYMQAADVTGGTYRRIYMPPLNSSTVAANLFAIVSGATNCMIPAPNGFRFLKVETTATVDNGATFRVVCGD